jgi:GcrA cell cycle regulator
MLWTDEEIRELISLWPTHSAAQLAMRLHRPKSAITGKVKRLRQEGVLPLEGIKHYDVARVRARPRPTRGSTASSGASSFTFGAANPANALTMMDMAPCSILELDDSRCHWPLGEVHKVAALFCGGVAETDCPYCTHHLQMARGNRG